MLKSKLKTLLRKEDSKIDKIQENKKTLIEAFVYEHYIIERWDKLLIKGYTTVVVGFDTEGVGYNIIILYKRINYQGNLDNIVYRIPLQYKLKNLGKYNGKQ